MLLALNTGVITIGYRKRKNNSHDWQIFGDLDFLGLHKHDYVTHWMSLPELPIFDEQYNYDEKYLYPKNSSK